MTDLCGDCTDAVAILERAANEAVAACRGDDAANIVALALVQVGVARMAHLLGLDWANTYRLHMDTAEIIKRYAGGMHETNGGDGS